MWTTLIICITLVLLAILTLCAWLPFLKWGVEVLRELGAEGLASLAAYVRSWPHPLSWVGKAGPRNQLEALPAEGESTVEDDPEPADDIDDVA